MRRALLWVRKWALCVLAAWFVGVVLAIGASWSDKLQVLFLLTTFLGAGAEATLNVLTDRHRAEKAELIAELIIIKERRDQFGVELAKHCIPWPDMRELDSMKELQRRIEAEK